MNGKSPVISTAPAFVLRPRRMNGIFFSSIGYGYLRLTPNKHCDLKIPMVGALAINWHRTDFETLVVMI
jgi:hypothetical protein